MPHPALHRGLRELGATTRLLADHWSALADELGHDGAALRAGAGEARQLLAALGPLAAARDVPVGPAARAVGARLAGGWTMLGDRLLERNQALRVAVLDIQHVVTLLGYLENVARADEDPELAAACAAWASRLSAHEEVARAVAAASGERPDEAIAAARAGTGGRIGHRLAASVGAVGEWADRRLGQPSSSR